MAGSALVGGAGRAVLPRQELGQVVVLVGVAEGVEPSGRPLGDEVEAERRGHGRLTQK